MISGPRYTPPVARSIPAVPKDFFYQRGLGSGAPSGSDQQIRAVLRFDGPLDLVLLRRTIAAVVAADPILRARLVLTGRFEGRWELREDAEAIPPCALHEVEDAGPAAAWLADVTVRDEGPYFRLAVFRAAGRDTLCLRVDHRLCDGGGTRLLLHRLLDTYRALAAGAPGPAPRDTFTPRSVHDLLGRVPAPPPPANPLRFSSLSFAVPRTGTSNERPRHALQVVDAATVAAARARGKPLGATVTDLVLAALARALAPYVVAPPGTPLVLMVSSDLRSRLPPETPEGLCNLFQGYFPGITWDPARPLEAAIAEAAQAMGRVRAGLTLEDALSQEVAFAATYRDLLAATERRPPEAQPGARVPTFMLLSNVGVLDPPELGPGCPALVDAQLLGTVSLAPSLLLCSSSFRGALTLSMGHCESDVPAAIIDGIVERTADALRAFAAGGD